MAESVSVAMAVMALQNHFEDYGRQIEFSQRKVTELSQELETAHNHTASLQSELERAGQRIALLMESLKEARAGRDIPHEFLSMAEGLSTVLLESDDDTDMSPATPQTPGSPKTPKKKESGLAKRISTPSRLSVSTGSENDLLELPLSAHLKRSKGKPEHQLLLDYTKTLVGDTQQLQVRVADLALHSPATPGRARHDFHPAEAQQSSFTPDSPLAKQNTMKDIADVFQLTGASVTRTDWKLKRRFGAHLGPVQDLAFLPGKRLLCSVGRDATARVWNVQDIILNKKRRGFATFDPLIVLRGSIRPLTAVTATPDHVIAGDVGGSLYLFSLAESSLGVFGDFDSSIPHLINQLEPHSEPIWALDSFGNIVAAGSADGDVSIYELHDGNLKQLHVISREPGTDIDGVEALPPAVSDLALTSERLIGCWTDNTVIVTDLVTMAVERQITVTGSPTCLATSRLNDRLCVVGCRDGSASLIDLLSAEPVVETWQAHPSPILSLAFDPNGIGLISTAHDGSARLWTLNDGKYHLAQEYKPHIRVDSEGIWAICFDDALAVFATGGADGAICVFQ